jgi:hypothetical protein
VAAAQMVNGVNRPHLLDHASDVLCTLQTTENQRCCTWKWPCWRRRMLEQMIPPTIVCSARRPASGGLTLQTPSWSLNPLPLSRAHIDRVRASAVAKPMAAKPAVATHFAHGRNLVVCGEDAATLVAICAARLRSKDPWQPLCQARM